MDENSIDSNDSMKMLAYPSTAFAAEQFDKPILMSLWLLHF